MNVPPKEKSRSTIQEETKVLSICAEELDKLDSGTQERVLSYLKHRFLAPQLVFIKPEPIKKWRKYFDR